MTLVFSALPTEVVARLRSGAPDANGQLPERHVSDGSGNPCRHCLRDIPAGAPMLVLAFRPFPSLQPYAETGPIFLCALDCARHPESGTMPDIFAVRESVLLKGADDRIVYGTGALVPGRDVPAACAAILGSPRVAYVHLRSARNNCYQARVDRAA